MILCFSGTGNSAFVADALAERLGDQVVSLNDVLRARKTAPRFASEDGKPFVVVFPIYAWRMPDPVADLLRRAAFTGSNQVYFVATMGADHGAAGAYLEQLAAQIGLTYRGLAGVVMPDNCIWLFDMPAPEKARATIRAALPAIDAVAEKIQAGAILEDAERGKLASKLKSSGALHALFGGMIISDKAFRVSDACVGCGQCANVCPMDNIELVESKPVFAGGCCACYGCIQRCPQRAIDIKGRTEKRGRYVCPAYRAFA